MFMFKKLLAIASVLVTIVAATAATSASAFFVYQPREPKSLRK
jgi:cyclic lactone autoinducer peptide